MLHLQPVSAWTSHISSAHCAQWPVVPVLDSAGSRPLLPRAMPFTENKNKSLEGTVLCVRAAASAVGTFAFITA